MPDIKLIPPPEGDWIVFADKNEAEAVRSQIDARLGYPKDGVDIGDGIHASSEESVTNHYGPIEDDGVRGALWVDSVVSDELLALKVEASARVDAMLGSPDDVKLILLPDPKPLDASWDKVEVDRPIADKPEEEIIIP